MSPGLFTCLLHCKIGIHEEIRTDSFIVKVYILCAIIPQELGVVLPNFVLRFDVEGFCATAVSIFQTLDGSSASIILDFLMRAALTTMSSK